MARRLAMALAILAVLGAAWVVAKGANDRWGENGCRFSSKAADDAFQVYSDLAEARFDLYSLEDRTESKPAVDAARAKWEGYREQNEACRARVSEDVRSFRAISGQGWAVLGLISAAWILYPRSTKT